MAVWSTVALLLAAVGAGLAATAARASGVEVWVGYADTLRANPANFPTPWEGGANVTYEGCSPRADCVFDAGAVRIVNNSASAVTIDSVAVKVASCAHDMWAPATLAPGAQLIVTQTVSGAGDGCDTDGTMDTSDIGPDGGPYAGNCTPDGVLPEVDVSIDGVASSFTDRGQILNTGGFDLAECPSGTNESTQWTSIGSQPCAGSTLTLAPTDQTRTVGDTADVTATYANSCGEPLQGAVVRFAVTSGPNAGTTGTAATDASGQADFRYSGVTVGDDTVDASIENPAGTIPSNDAHVRWTVPFAPGGGSFVISAQKAAIGSSVSFWGAQWWKLDPLVPTLAPASFKGFALNPTTPSCGARWSTDPGNSAPPPAGPLPPYMGVIVTSAASQSGSAISGDTPHIVVVKTDPGYLPDPGHAGTGTVVSQVC